MVIFSPFSRASISRKRPNTPTLKQWTNHPQPRRIPVSCENCVEHFGPFLSYCFRSELYRRMLASFCFTKGNVAPRYGKGLLGDFVGEQRNKKESECLIRTELFSCKNMLQVFQREEKEGMTIVPFCTNSELPAAEDRHQAMKPLETQFPKPRCLFCLLFHNNSVALLLFHIKEKEKKKDEGSRWIFS